MSKSAMSTVTTTFTLIASVSFARTPLDEISTRSEEIRALGWEEATGRRGDPWVVSYRKDFPRHQGEASDVELQTVMGDYWLDREEIKELLASTSG